MRRFLVACCCLLAAFAARADVRDVDNGELAKLMASGVPVIDVRTAPEWEETGVVAGSHLLTFFDERGQADPAAWLKKAEAVAKPGEPVAIICRSGRRSKAVGQFLTQQAGYGKVYNVRDGIQGWVKERQPVVPAATALASCRKARTC